MNPCTNPCLPATVRLVGPWSETDQAQVSATLTPLLDRLAEPWTLTYERDEAGTGRHRTLMHAYSAAVERDGQAQQVITRCWDLPMFLRQLAAHIRGEAGPRPIRRSPLEFGRWYTKKEFEKRYQTSRWLHVVIIDGGSVRVRVRPYDIQNLVRSHKDAYFQFAWNDQPHEREQKIMVKGRRSSERFQTIPVTDPPYSTVKLRICYALTPEKNTEVILHDGYGLPEVDRWWENVTGCDIALPLPAEAQAAPELACEVAA